MQRFHVENAALELGLYPPDSSVPNCLVGHEHSIFPLHPKHEGLSEAGGLLQISSASPTINKFPTAAEERPASNLPEHGYGGLFDSSAEMRGLNFNRIAALAAENQIPKEKKGSSGGIKRQETMEGDRNLEAEVTCFRPDAFVSSEEETHAQASMAAPVSGVNFDRVCGFQASRALPIVVDSYGGRGAEHSPRNKGLYMDDLQASMAARACEPSPGEKKAFWRFLHSNQEEYSMDLVCSDEFCMYEFKVRRCMRGRSHDWTECPFAHPGEKARRRDPRSYSYSGTACPDYRKGACRKGDGCELAHGVFECWLHPARYRTQPCKDGKACRRRVCFFAHSPSQLRLVSPDSTVSNEQLALSRAPMASSADSKAGYCNTTFKRPPLFRDAGNEAFNGIGPTGLFDDFCPQGLNTFRTDGIQDAISPISARRHNPDNSSIHAHKFESYATRNSNQLSIDDLSVLVEPNSDRNCSHGSVSALDVDYSAYEGRKGHGYYASNSPHSPTLGNFSLNAEGNFRTHLALAGLRGSFDEIMSPTSTLLGHQVFSPPPLSPPLSPAESPRASPDTAFSAWNCTLSRKMASLACSHPLSYDALSPNLTIGGDGMHSLTNNYLPNTHHGSSVHMPSPLSVICNGDQIDDFGGLDALQKASCMKKERAEMSMDPNLPAQAIKDLILTLKDQRFAGMDMKIRKRCPSLLQRMQSPEASRGREGCGGVRSLPVILTHHSGQDLRDRLNEKMPAEEMDNLDLGWVTELVN